MPHFDAVHGVQHIVFRLADSLPASVLQRLHDQPTAKRLEAAEEMLDLGVGWRILGDRRVAALVRSSLLHFDAIRYRLLAWCVMPTHVHVLLAAQTEWPLDRIVHGWKSFTANEANKVLGRSGRFWAPEYFDRLMRDEGEVELATRYIEHNPVVAGLCLQAADWPWSSAGARASSPLR